MAHVTESAIRAWQAGWGDAKDDVWRKRVPPHNIGKHPSAYILGYFAFREAIILSVSWDAASADYDSRLAFFMENYDL